MFKLIFLSFLSLSLFAKDSVFIDKQFFLIEYSSFHKGPLKVSYSLNKNVDHLNIKKRSNFYTEPSLPKDIAVHYDDFTNTGMDRGHLAPDASFDWSIDSLNATYSMANITPQYPVVNRKIWANIELLERYNASQFNHLDVINFVDYSNFTILKKEPIEDSLASFLKNNQFKSDKHKSNYINQKLKASSYLEKKQIHVPSGFYKIMINKKHNFKECFYVPNKPDLTDFKPHSYKIDCSTFKGLF